MSDASALARSLIVWLVPFAAVIAAIGIETDWGRSFNRDAPAPSVTPPSTGSTAAPKRGAKRWIACCSTRHADRRRPRRKPPDPPPR